MIKILIADDSPFIRKVLRQIYKDSEEFQIVGEASNGSDAIDLVKILRPDILILDLEMPVLNGFEALKVIMKEAPLPVIIFSSFNLKGAEQTIKALEFGAIDYLTKPFASYDKIDVITKDLSAKIKNIVKSFRQSVKNQNSKSDKKSNLIIGNCNDVNSRKIDLIVFGASTGGVQAASNILPQFFGKTCPIVWVQHMPQNFTATFAERLNDISELNVKEAIDNEPLKKGYCYIAPGGKHIEIRNNSGRFSLHTFIGDEICTNKPSINVMFYSVSEHFSNNAIGVVLTGMGNDGAKGILAMHKAGAFTIGQNKETSVIYGMPKAAKDKGAIDIELPLEKIADYINKLSFF